MGDPEVWDSNFEIGLCPYCHKPMLWNVESGKLECYNPKCPARLSLNDDLLSFGGK